MSPVGLSSLEIRMKVLSPNCYNFKSFQDWLRLLDPCTPNSAHFKNVFFSIFGSSFG